ncbi:MULTISPECIES: carboxymuconolactone decarboxylase family protein [unclassified Streptomyces]|uniref:Carboxymuconolactone decarboxylase family protein n=1 Tax=Streptomyces sp. NBC_00119 TaxID=2975659 RepID=A0AAU1U9W1_9ACTN|nr:MULTISPECIES: carboxymuconolactone decarboxylase family protein [unclassified Streptomyces]MCX4643655.1 carboxymuconolactone decarboxylase family protein [Streptomyces sp. NBC_01446]MCX5324765.1 carboxymuconolactone decarboxylase family protein [Streptomyces sp. NBC_00120]
MTARTTHLDAGVRDAMIALGAAAKKGLGDPVLAELVMIRASQINACAFCLDMHVDLAVEKNGESAKRIALLNAWAEAPEQFTERERAALALTEAVTVLTDGFVPDETYEAAAKHFGEDELAHLLGVITVINSWNRLMVSRRIVPGGPQW